MPRIAQFGDYGQVEFPDDFTDDQIRQELSKSKDRLIKYFEDKSNLDEDIKRNSFRHNYSTPLLEKYLTGIKKSFDYIDKDREELLDDIEIKTINKFAYFKSSQNRRADIYTIDKYLKSQLHLMSANERELLKSEQSAVLGRKFIVNQNNSFVFIAPFITSDMTHEFKEKCRVLKIEPKLRPYLYEDKEAFLEVQKLIATI